MIAAEPQPELIPVRALNQVTYCPRLYWLQYVEGLMVINEHVEDGILKHGRVNDSRMAGRPRQERAAIHTRSVSLASAQLCLTSKLDLIEEKGGEVYPIEYKRSAAPTDANGQATYWDNDAIQLCAQGLLLEEHLGRPVPYGLLYYVGSKTRVKVSLDKILRQQTRDAMARIRAIADSDQPPPPLPPELTYRCHGCSLLTVCQPEETRFLRSAAPEAAAPLKSRVLPELDEGAVLYLQEQGSYVGKRSEHLVVSLERQEINRIPLAAVRQVVLFGNVQISTQALETLVEHEIPVVLLTRYGRFIGAMTPAPSKNVMLRVNQYRTFSEPASALALARAVVKAKIANQRVLLMRSLRAKGQEDEEPVRGSDDPAAVEMARMLARVDEAPHTDLLLGLEGQAASAYFGAFGRMLHASVPGRGFDFQARNRRPPRDPVNALLSFGYAMLAKDTFSAVLTVGFDPYLGFYHGGKHGRPSLALDLMEEFRAVIVDSVVLTLVNNGMLTASDFVQWNGPISAASNAAAPLKRMEGACQLTDAGRRTFFETYERRKATVVTHPLFGYRMSYGRMLEVQARLLAAYIRGDVPAYQGFTVR
jgi:CRISPR-associated protein Cas1